MATSTTFCFKIDMAPTCQPDPYGCCSLFEQNLIKILITTYTRCISKKLVVTLNGVKRGGGIYFDSLSSTEAQLRITNLGMNKSNVAGGVTICLTPPLPCNSVESFCGPNCQYAIFDPFRHACCPTCPFPFSDLNGYVQNLPPPPPESPPSPPPPQSHPPPPESPPPPPPESPPTPPPESPPESPPPPPPESPPPPPPKSPPPPPFTCTCQKCTQCKCT